MGLPYVSSAGATAISLPLNENGLLVQSVDWSASTDSTIYKSAALQGAVVWRQDRNPIMRLSVDAYMLSTTSGVPGYYPGQAVTSTDLSNWGTSAVGSYMLGWTYTGGKIVLENPSVSADGESNPRWRGTFVAYPFCG